MLYFFEPERRAVGHAAFPAGRRLTLVFGFMTIGTTSGCGSGRDQFGRA